MCQLFQRPTWQLGDILRTQAVQPTRNATRRRPSRLRCCARRLAACRTAALGGHIDACGACGFTRVSYNSCRDRHCPKCQAAKRAEWLETRLERLLPIPYFHVVFTVPDILYPLMLHILRRLYDLLFRTASATLLRLAADPHRLGAQIGITALLHTWGQNLLFHPHLHCVVTGGGLSPDGQRWLACKPHFFLPVKVLRKLFRGKFLAGLKDAYQAGLLSLDGRARRRLPTRRLFNVCSTPAMAASGSFTPSRPSAVRNGSSGYLGRYSHRVGHLFEHAAYAAWTTRMSHSSGRTMPTVTRPK